VYAFQPARCSYDQLRSVHVVRGRSLCSHRILSSSWRMGLFLQSPCIASAHCTDVVGGAYLHACVRVPECIYSSNRRTNSNRLGLWVVMPEPVHSPPWQPRLDETASRLAGHAEAVHPTLNFFIHTLLVTQHQLDLGCVVMSQPTRCQTNRHIQMRRPNSLIRSNAAARCPILSCTTAVHPHAAVGVCKR